MTTLQEQGVLRRFNKEQLVKAEFLAIISVVVFGVLIAVSAFFTGLDNVIERFSLIDSKHLVWLVGLSLINYVLRGARWPLFTRGLNIQVPIWRTALYYTTGYAMVMTPGKVGTMLRIWFFKKCHNYSYSRTAPMLFMDQLTDAAGMMTIAILGILFSFGGYGAYGVSLVVLGCVLAGVLLLFYKPDLLIRLVKAGYVLLGRRFKRLFGFVLKTIRHTRTLFTPTMLGFSTLMAFSGWMLEIVAFWWLLEVLGAHITLPQAMFIFAFATMIGGISLLPGGLGSMEATMFALLVAVNVPADAAIAATAIIRLCTLWLAIAIGFMALPFGLRLANKPQV